MLKTVSTQLALASDTLPEVLAKGNTTGGTDLAVSSGDDITFADSSKAIFGAGSDLQIYSDGTAGLIKVNTVYGLGDITITQSADNKGIAILDSTESGAFYLRHNAANTFISNNDTRDMILATNSFDRLTLDGTTGAATFSDNIIIGTSGKGIDFSATAGTGTSELLDDYEEGTWTAVDSSGAGVAIVSNYAVYTKIGNAVTISCYISVPAGAAGAVALLGGLPYAPATNNNVMVAHNDGALDIIGKTNTASFLVINPSGSSSTTVWSSLAGNYVFITGTYYV